MNDNQRNRILQNIDSLVDFTDFKTLCDACYRNNLLSYTMIQNIHHVEPENSLADTFDEDTIKRERHKRLFVKITKRGPEAFEMLCRILLDLKYIDALKKLHDDDKGMISISSSKKTGTATSGNTEINHVNVANNNIDDRDGTISRQFSRCDSDDITLHQYADTIQPKKDVNVLKAKRILKHNSIDTYSMESKNNRGVFFMVNIVDFPTEERRSGADEDTHSLLSLFKQLDFKLYAYKNLTQKKFFALLDELLSSDEIRDTECFVMALMTHGQMSDGVQWIYFHDGSVVKVKEIEKRFYHENCTQLVGKPKIFIYPYCRGEISDKGVNVVSKTQTEGVGTTRRAINNIAQLSDVIKCYATTAGFVAHRDVENGSWYIQSFVDIMAAHAYNTSFEEMLKIIQAGISKLRTNNNELQTASYVNIGFNKILYFNPGIYAN
ncbi:caspase Dronc-like [Lucilia cuprina]|uniref:caspase Dronc-like n=1 Tax=Lucilia cuprina TaxID=7375 RepID=UPI001F06E025|nr:caspase Dronc-like [Lucilia cuprina]XP_023293899.2 caspase Dronc-like [Lucilia cuprina]